MAIDYVTAEIVSRIAPVGSPGNNGNVQGNYGYEFKGQPDDRLNPVEQAKALVERDPRESLPNYQVSGYAGVHDPSHALTTAAELGIGPEDRTLRIQVDYPAKTRYQAFQDVFGDCC